MKAISLLISIVRVVGLSSIAQAAEAAVFQANLRLGSATATFDSDTNELEWPVA